MQFHIWGTYIWLHLISESFLIPQRHLYLLFRMTGKFVPLQKFKKQNPCL